MADPFQDEEEEETYICFRILYEEELVHLLNSTTENIRKQTLALTFRRRLFAFSSLDPHGKARRREQNSHLDGRRGANGEYVNCFRELLSPAEETTSWRLSTSMMEYSP